MQTFVLESSLLLSDLEELISDITSSRSNTRNFDNLNLEGENQLAFFKPTDENLDIEVNDAINVIHESAWAIDSWNRAEYFALVTTDGVILDDSADEFFDTTQESDLGVAFWNKADRLAVVIAGGAALGGMVAQIPGAIVGSVIGLSYGCYITLISPKVS
ncbi:MAG: hypothetical protein AAGG51_04300 [Cyanobacteria bacterium P01_G01_bin.54]